MAAETSFQAVMRDLRAGNYHPVYCLYGYEPYYIDAIARYIISHILTPDEKAFNETIVYGHDVTAAQVADTARRYPLGADRQVVVVRDAQKMNNTSALEKYLAAPQYATLLVLCYSNGTGPDKKKNLYRLAEKTGVVFESKKARERDLPAFIDTYLHEKGVSIDRKAEQLIIDDVGTDLTRLTGEMDKLILSLHDEKTIRPVHVERAIGVNKDYNTYELRNAVAAKNAAKAFQIMNYFNASQRGANIQVIVPMLFNFFQNILVAYYTQWNNSPERLAGILALRSPWAAKEYILAMKNYSASRTLEIIRKIHEIDTKSKGIDNCNTPAGELLQELLTFILH